jgi:hypothetical protein
VETGKHVLLKSSTSFKFPDGGSGEMRDLLQLQPELRKLELLLCQYLCPPGATDPGVAGRPRGNKVIFSASLKQCGVEGIGGSLLSIISIA